MREHFTIPSQAADASRSDFASLSRCPQLVHSQALDHIELHSRYSFYRYLGRLPKHALRDSNRLQIQYKCRLHYLPRNVRRQMNRLPLQRNMSEMNCIWFQMQSKFYLATQLGSLQNKHPQQEPTASTIDAATMPSVKNSLTF